MNKIPLTAKQTTCNTCTPNVGRVTKRTCIALLTNAPNLSLRTAIRHIIHNTSASNTKNNHARSEC